MYLWVAPVEVIRSGMPESVGNNVPTSTTVCLYDFNEIVPCISTCRSGQHLASSEPVCDLLLRKWAVQQRCFEIKCAGASHAAHAEAQERELHVQVVRRPFITREQFTHFCGTFSGLCHLHVQFWYSLNGLRYGKKEFLLGCKSDGTYEVPRLTCQSINCILEDALIAKMIEFSGGSLGPNEWLKYQYGDGHTLSEIPDSSDLFTVTCLDGDHTMTHCKPEQCGNPHMIAQATPLGGSFVTITYGKQVKYQREAGYHVESEREFGSKPEGCRATERAEPVRPVQVPEEPVSAVSSCGHVAALEESFASWTGQQERPFPSHEWLEDRSCARCEEMSHWAVLITGPPGTGETDAVRLLARHVRGTFLECDIREVRGRKLVVLILKGQGGLRQTSVAILNIDTDVTDGLKLRLCKATQQLQIPLIFVSNMALSLHGTSWFRSACVCRFDMNHITSSRRCDE